MDGLIRLPPALSPSLVGFYVAAAQLATFAVSADGQTRRGEANNHESLARGNVKNMDATPGPQRNPPIHLAAPGIGT
jgi:hypothetical protein